MLNKKTAFVIGVSILFGLEWSKIYVSDNFERPNIFKLKRLIIKATTSLANLSAQLNIGTEYANLRNFLRVLGSVLRFSKPDIEISKTKIDNVNVKIYYPKTYAESKEIPLMIYFHGGAYVFGSLDDYDELLAEYVKRLNIVAVSVDYRLAPEFPYPEPTSDCYKVTKFIFENPAQFKADPKRIILAGDSAGGNAVAVTTQRLLAEKQQLPKLQVLIYPWTQLVNLRLPSSIKYAGTGLLSSFSKKPSQYVAWYLGLNNVTEEIQRAIFTNEYVALADIEIRGKLDKYLDINQIPLEYKSGKNYYESYETQKQYYYPKSLPDNHLLKQNKELARVMSQLLDSRVSPLLADDNQLIGLPKAYFIICEWDTIKDEGLIYAERLKQAGVDVKVNFYEDAFHGIVGFIHPLTGYNIARTMFEDLVNYIRENL